jgi:hypothetical protein
VLQVMQPYMVPLYAAHATLAHALHASLERVFGRSHLLLPAFAGAATCAAPAPADVVLQLSVWVQLVGSFVLPLHLVLCIHCCFRQQVLQDYACHLAGAQAAAQAAAAQAAAAQAAAAQAPPSPSTSPSAQAEAAAAAGDPLELLQGALAWRLPRSTPRQRQAIAVDLVGAMMHQRMRTTPSGLVALVVKNAVILGALAGLAWHVAAVVAWAMPHWAPDSSVGPLAAPAGVLSAARASGS